MSLSAATYLYHPFTLFADFDRLLDIAWNTRLTNPKLDLGRPNQDPIFAGSLTHPRSAIVFYERVR